MSWKTIRLELSGGQDFPTGSVSRGYLFRAPLNASGSIDEAILAEAPNRATVRRFWSSEPDENGSIVRTNGHWAFRWGDKLDQLLSSGSFELGKEVMLAGRDGARRAFRVASIRSLG